MSVCSYDTCEKPHKGGGYCQGHLRQLRLGRELSPLRYVNRGSGYKKSDGYILLFLPDYPGATKSGHVLEHRYMMEQTLGRPLAPTESVHHKNGIRHDNRPENLELWVVPQPAGQRVDDLVSWLVSNYEQEILNRMDLMKNA